MLYEVRSARNVQQRCSGHYSLSIRGPGARRRNMKGHLIYTQRSGRKHNQHQRI